MKLGASTVRSIKALKSDDRHKSSSSSPKTLGLYQPEPRNVNCRATSPVNDFAAEGGTALSGGPVQIQVDSPT